MGNFIHLDVAVVIVILISLFTGLIRGFKKEFFSLITWLIAFVLATTFSSGLAHQFISVNAMQPDIANLPGNIILPQSQDSSLMTLAICFAGIFFSTLLVGAVLSFYASQGGSGNELGLVSRFLGTVLGFVRGILLIFLVMFLLSISTLAMDPWVINSYYANLFQPSVKWLGYKVDPDIDNMKTKAGAMPASTNFLKGIGGPGV